VSRVEHILNRRQEMARKARVIFEKAGPGRRRARTDTKVVGKDVDDKLIIKTVGVTYRGQHKQGAGWWRAQLADMVERRSTITKKYGHSEVTYKPRDRKVAPTIRPRGVVPERLPRPDGITRQMHRRVYRQACKAAGVPWRS
jgi:hypothetical protein